MADKKDATPTVAADSLQKPPKQDRFLERYKSLQEASTSLGQFLATIPQPPETMYETKMFEFCLQAQDKINRARTPLMKSRQR